MKKVEIMPKFVVNMETIEKKNINPKKVFEQSAKTNTTKTKGKTKSNQKETKKGFDTS